MKHAPDLVGAVPTARGGAVPAPSMAAAGGVAGATGGVAVRRGPRLHAFRALLMGAALLSAWLLLRWRVQALHGLPLIPRSVRFDAPWWGLLVLPVLGGWAWAWYGSRAGSRHLPVSEAMLLMAAGPGRRVWWRDLLPALRAVALLLMVLAAMGPRSLMALERATTTGIDIVFVLDLSGSMQAQDVAPSRFVAMQQVVDAFITERPRDRMGAVVFGREAYTLLPLTTDHAALRRTIAAMQLGMIDGRSTALGNAVGVALNRLRDSQAKSRVIIALTDGEANHGHITPRTAAELAKTLGVKIYPVLLGVAGGEAPPSTAQGWLRRFFRTPGGVAVNPALLRAMAQTSGGQFFSVSDRAGLERSFHAILNRLARSELKDPLRHHAALFPSFLWVALAFVLLAQLLHWTLLRRWP
ncbi:MAG: vWA domain-containing protein [Polyangiales bacterium]